MCKIYYSSRAVGLVMGMLMASFAATSSSTAADEAAPPAETAVAPEAPAQVDTPLELPAGFAEQIAASLAQQAEPDPSTVLATVNGTDITMGEFNKEMEVMMNRMQGRVPPERLGQMRMQMRDQLLDNLITRQVLLDQVKADNIAVTSEEFDEAVGELTANLPDGVTLNDMLAQTETSEEEFKKTLTSELEIRKLIENHTGKPTDATDEEIETFYKENQEQFERPETVTASHILIGTEPTDSDEAKAAKRAELEAIKKQLDEGGDFAALAGEHSTCPSKAQGGNLGSFPKGRMVPEFEDAAFSQEVGKVGDIVETQFGYHLIKVDERNDAGITPLEEIKEQLGKYLASQKQQESVQTYIEGLRKTADVKVAGGESASPEM
jgi:peptidyl-prolyl cis-trans isomerase C